MKAKRDPYTSDELELGLVALTLTPVAVDDKAPMAADLSASDAEPGEVHLRPPPANEPLAFGCLVVGRDVHVKGTLTVPGTLRVEGRIDGNVVAAELILLSGGMVVGEVACDLGVIRGTLSGSLRCSEQLVIMANANVEGEISYHKEIRVEPGAILNCTLTYRNDSAPIHRVVATDKDEQRAFDEHKQPRASLMTRMFGPGKHQRT